MVLCKVKGNKPFSPYASLSDSKSLLATWRATAVLGTSLEHGERLANLGWRMWSVRDEMVDPDEDEDAKAPGRKAFERRAKYTVEALERTKAKSLVTQGPMPYDDATGAILEARTRTRRKARQDWEDKQAAARGKGKARQMDSTPSVNVASASTSNNTAAAAAQRPLRVRTTTSRSRSTQGPLWPIVPSTALPDDPYIEPDPLGEPAWTIEAIEAAERELAAQGVDLQGPSLALLGDMKRAELARQCAARNREAAIARAQAAAAAAGNDMGMGAGPGQDWPSSSAMPGMLGGWGGQAVGQDPMRQTPMLQQHNALQPFVQSPGAFDSPGQMPGQQPAPAPTNGLHPAVLSFLMQVVSAAQGQGSIQSLGALLGQMQPRPPQQGEDPNAAFQQHIHQQPQQPHHPQQPQQHQQHPLSQMMQAGPSSMPDAMMQGSVPGQTPYYSPRGSFSLGLDNNGLGSPHSVTGSLSMNQHQVGGGGPFHAPGSNASGMPASMSMPGSPMGPYDAQTPFNFASPETHRPRTSTVASAPTPSKASDDTHRPQAGASTADTSSNTAGSSTSDGPKPECHNCGATSTPLWRRDEKFNLQCNACGLYLKLHKVPRPRMLKQRRAERVAKQAAAANGGDGSGINVSSPGGSDEWIGRNAGATCANCGTSTTPLWRKDPEGRIICNACGLYYKLRNAHRPVEMRADIIRKRSRYDERRPRDFSATPAAGSTPASGSSVGRNNDTTMAPPPHAHHNYNAQEGSGLANEFKPNEQHHPMQVPPPEGSVFLPTELLDSQACPMGAWGEACCQNLPLAPAGSPTNVAPPGQHAPSGVNLAEALRLLIAGGGVGSIANGANLPPDWASGLELDANGNASGQGSNAQLYASPSASTAAHPTPNFSHNAYGHSGAPTPTGLDEAPHGGSKRQRTESVSFAATPRPHRANSQASEASNITAANHAATASLEADWWASLANTPTAGPQHTNTPEGNALQPPQPAP